MKNNKKIKAMGNRTPTMDHYPRNRWKVTILNLTCHVNPVNE